MSPLTFSNNLEISRIFHTKNNCDEITPFVNYIKSAKTNFARRVRRSSDSKKCVGAIRHARVRISIRHWNWHPRGSHHEDNCSSRRVPSKRPFRHTFFGNRKKKKLSISLFNSMSIAFLPEKISSEKICRSYGPLPNLGRLTVVYIIIVYV